MSKGNGGIEDDESDSLSSSDDSLSEIIDIENGSPESDSNQSAISGRSLFRYVTGGIDVQTSDILMIEHLADEIHARSSDEILTSPSHECQINVDDDDSQLAFTYFDNSDQCQEENLQKIEACSFPQNWENGNSLNTLDKKGESGSEFIDKTIDARNKNKMKEMPQEEISTTEKQKQRSQIIENPCTQIFKFMHPKLDDRCEKSFREDNKSNLLKCPDYGSDEFADIEDNAKDSSSSDNNDSTRDVNILVLKKQDAIFTPEGIDSDEQASESMEERTSTVFPTRSEVGLSEDENGPSTSQQSYNIGASCSHTHNRDTGQIQDIAGPAKSGANKVFKMPKVAEVADFNDNEMSPKDCKSPHRKANPLKMKTKVGMRKDKCNVCRARLGLCAIKCRCGGYYCAKHRYDKEHNCTFDYKSLGAEEIRKNNPRIIAEKIRKL